MPCTRARHIRRDQRRPIWTWVRRGRTDSHTYTHTSSTGALLQGVKRESFQGLSEAGGGLLDRRNNSVQK